MFNHSPWHCCLRCVCCCCCLFLYCVQAAPFAGRRLQQSGNATYDINLVAKAAFPGSVTPALETAGLIDKNPCGIQGLCDKVSNVAVVYTSGAVILTTDLNVTMPGEFDGQNLEFSTQYIEDGKPVGIPVIVTVQTGSSISCTNRLVEGTRYYKCAVVNTPGTWLTVTITAPNTADPALTIKKVFTLRSPGKVQCMARKRQQLSHQSLAQVEQRLALQAILTQSPNGAQDVCLNPLMELVHSNVTYLKRFGHR